MNMNEANGHPAHRSKPGRRTDPNCGTSVPLASRGLCGGSGTEVPFWASLAVPPRRAAAKADR
jgi:hypothetical protein